MRVAAVLTCALLGCAYKPGSFVYPLKSFPGQRTTVGCLDLAVQRRADMAGSAVLDYQFGNRCDRPVAVDLVRVAVVGRTVDGVEVTLTPYDPKGEMQALRIDGRVGGGEAIAYPAEQPLAQVCVDVASLAGEQPARWMCFGGEAVLASAGQAATTPATDARADETADAAALETAPTLEVTRVTDGEAP